MEQLDNYIEITYDKLLEISKRITSNRFPDYYDLLHESIEGLYNADKTKIIKIINVIKPLITSSNCSQQNNFMIIQKKHKITLKDNIKDNIELKFLIKLIF